ncbi:MAG: hypothetical protein ACREVB_10755 [Burkholderiales bacterium]
MKVLKTIVLALSFATGGCAMLDFKQLGKQTLKNEQGHVIGYKERFCDCAAGEELDRVVLFTPRLSTSGRVMAYEERIKGGVVLWDLRGKRIGSRYVDLRSRGTNAHNSGLTIVFVPKDAERLAAQQMIAQVTIDDIKKHLEITN